ncbi:GlsB/YeaQ/YmgE family stress response membrane protein [Rhodomicrobium sp. Az07]|uniref:GlsB/YeaQ/YmgE family stress response membrane protein n=1 Tax=Rhodomicrobium sp. Az07 TaxID=2839034 RepID=UPI001BEB4060|nr:GlsB/YeaQ/YmgE family stress response membrane protein [Rhodomicrobium sp. Az07]MBT3069728.1 GlsB/YeaQ/YmgE family stress response membrane protein [Rhodomicrobium sp. Az07]
MADAYSILYIVLIGLAAGVLASLVVPTGLDLLGAIVVGIIGAAIGFYLFPALGARVTGDPTVASIITATVGAILLLVVLRLVRR